MLDPKYFQWVKFDLHHHTIDDKARRENSKNLDEYKEILDHANEKELKLICITDHNQISWNAFNNYKKYVKNQQYEITILPGVEMNFKVTRIEKDKNLDINFIFDDVNIEKLKKVFDDYFKKNNFDTDSRLDFDTKYDDFCNTLRNKKIDFITIASLMRKSNSIDETGENKKKKYAFFDFYEGRLNNKIQIILAKKKLKYLENMTGRSLPKIITGTDIWAITLSRFQENLEKVTWFLGEWSFRGLMRIARHPEKRCFKEEQTIVDEYIEKIEIKNKTSGAITTLYLRPGLNVIIGRRGNGKSYLFNDIYKYIVDESPKNCDIIDKIHYKNNNDLTSSQICHCDQNALRNTMQTIQEEIKTTQTNLKEKMKHNNLAKLINNKENTLKTNLTNIKILYDNIITNFQELKKNTLNKIRQNFDIAKHGFKDKIKDKINNLFNPNVYKDNITKFDNDIDILNNALMNLQFVWTKEQITSVKKIIENELKTYKEYKKYNDLIQKIFNAVNKKNQNNNSKQTTTATTIIKTINNIINSVLKYNQNINSILTPLKESKKLFRQYQEKIQEYARNELENNFKIALKLKIKKNISFEEYLKTELKFIFTEKPYIDSWILSDWVNKYKQRKYQYTNEDYASFFEIEKIIYLNDEKLENLSPGQRQEKYLKEILKQKIKITTKLILLDQPEDNLDSETTTKCLIENFIFSEHFQKQIIIVTHDPKLALNSDPQALILANYSDVSSINYKNIDLFVINEQEVHSLLDGKKNYPLNRFEDYGGFNQKNE